MDLENVFLKTVALNHHIANSLVKKSSFDDKIASWKPHRISLDEWVENTGNTNLQDWIEENSKYFDDEEQPLDIPDESAESMVNSHPDAHIWNRLKKDKSNSDDSTFANKNILNLLKVAKYIEDRSDTIKSKLIRLIESHIQHIIGLVNRGNVPQAKEYLEVIRPRGWENNAERNVDKFYEQVIRGLSEKLEPEAFQALGL